MITEIYNGTPRADRLLGDGPNSSMVIMYGFGGDDLFEAGRLVNIRMHGGAGADILIGNNLYDKFLFGGSGNDRLESVHSNSPEDRAELFGGSGNDHLSNFNGWGLETILDGGLGRDTLEGDRGRDVYIVDHANDVIYEAYKPEFTNIYNPRDEVRSSISWTLGENLENLTLLGVDATEGRGNRLNNVISGNDGSNSLLGWAGRDKLLGGNGDDTLEGGAGNDRLTGGTGKDRLSGGSGADVFIYKNVVDTGKISATRDTITDFARGIDDIDLQAIDANSTRTGNQSFTFIGGATFSGTAGQLRFANGIVFGDVNGDRIADFTIAVNGVNALAAGDFVL